MRATKFGGTWRFQSKMHGDEQWTYYDVPLPEDLLTLQGIIERKYRRRRATADDVVAVEKLIQDHENNE